MKSERPRLNWELVAALAPVGLVMGFLMVGGAGLPTIPIAWMVACAVTALAIARWGESRWIARAVTIGVVWGVLHNVVESVMFDSYLANNPGFEDALSNPDFFPARYFVLLTGPVAGFATGLLVAAMTWVALKTGVGLKKVM